MVKPLLRKAICWNRERSVSKSKCVVSKISSLGQNVTVVPVWEADPTSRNCSTGSPTSKAMAHFAPSRQTSTSKRDDRALTRSEEHTSELQSRGHLVCRLLLEKKKER